MILLPFSAKKKSQENQWALGLLYIKWSLNMIPQKMNSGRLFKNLTKPSGNKERKMEKDRGVEG